MNASERNAIAVNSRIFDLAPLKEVDVPTYDRQTIKPGIVHIGVGAFHRSHQAHYIDQLCEHHGAKDWGIRGVGIMPQDESLATAMHRQDCLYSLTERSGGGDRCRIVGSIVDHILGLKEPDRVFEAIAAEETKIVSLTVTEGGYYIDESSGELNLDHPGVAHDVRRPEAPKTVFGFLLQGLARRQSQGSGPVTLLCCDNIQHNGDVVRDAMLRFAQAVNPAIADWISSSVSFPNCMVDRITPAPGQEERNFVRQRFGLDDLCPVVSESFTQWVVEDRFIAGRPPLETVGVQFVEDVTPYERMKIRLLNATHSAMGYLGHLLGYQYIHEVAQAPEFEPFLRQLMDQEMTPLVGTVPGIDLRVYKQDLLERFRNQDIRDTVLRICSGGSAKIPGFILPAIREAMESGTPTRALVCVVASWLRFCAGEDQQGNPIPLEDPMADRLRDTAQTARADPAPYMRMRDLFGELGQNQRFVDELRGFLDILWERGAQATLEEFSM